MIENIINLFKKGEKNIKTRSKGFTLIELLAVIIILAIIALIATPIILDVIDDTKKSAAKSEAAMIVSGVNNYCAAAKMQAQMTNAANICEDANGVDKTEIPTMVDLGNAKVNEIEYENGKVTKLVVESNGKTVTYDGSTFTIADETSIAPSGPSTPLGTTYYNYGMPTTDSVTSYTDLKRSNGTQRTVFAALQVDADNNEQLRTCIIKSGELVCLNENDDYATGKNKLTELFGSANCTPSDDAFRCEDDAFLSEVRTYGFMIFLDKSFGEHCSIMDGNAECNSF